MLQEWVKQYPAVPIYKAALLKVLKEEDHYSYNSVLKSAALHMPDRKVLYHFITSKNAEENADLIFGNNVNETLAEENNTFEFERETNLPLENVQEENATAVNDTLQTSNKSEVEETSETKNQALSSIQDVEHKIVEDESKSSQIENKSIEESTEEENEAFVVEAKVENVESTLAVNEENELDENIKATNDVVETKENTNVDENETTSLKNIEVESISHKETEEEHTFEDWLEFLEQHEIEEVEEAQLNEQIEEHVAASSYEAELNNEIDTLEKEEDEEVLSADEEKEVTTLANDSITLTTGAVTETLAKIMLMQGKINEAIVMYKQLCLKYPEKSNYFAAQIELIKNK